MAVLVDSLKTSLINGRLNIPIEYYLSTQDLEAMIALRMKWRSQEAVDTLEMQKWLEQHQGHMLVTFKALLDQNRAYCHCDFKKTLTIRNYVIIMETERNGVPQPMEIFVPLPECLCEGQEMALRIEDCFFLNGQLKLSDGIKIERKPHY